MTVATIDWCPFICPQSLSKPGLLVEYTKAIYADSPVEVSFDVYNWSRAIKLANEGKVDALLAPARNEAPKLLFPDTEIGVQRFCFFSRRDDNWQYKAPASLGRRTIIHPRDALPTILTDNKLHEAVFMTYPYNDAFIPTSTDVLLKARVDTVLMTYFSMLHYINKNQLKDKIQLSGCVSRQKLFLAFTPQKSQRPRIETLMAYYRKRITTLKKQYFFQGLMKKYNIKEYPSENDWK